MRRWRSSATPRRAAGAQVGVALEAVEQHPEALAEVTRPEVVEPGRRRALRRATSRRRGSGPPRQAPHPIRVEVLRHPAEAVAPSDRARPGDRARARVVGDRTARRTGDLGHHHLGLDPEQLTEERRVLLHAHRLVAGPVHDGRGDAGDVEERFEVRADVVVVDGAVGHRIPPRAHGLTGRDRVEVPDRQPALVAVRRPHPGDGHRELERAGAVARHAFLGDLRHRVRRRRRSHRVAERIVFAERVPRIGMRLVHGDGGHHQRGLGVAAVLEHEPGALGVDPQRAVVVVGAEVGHEVQQVGEVGGQVAEVAVGEVEGARGHTQLLHLVARRRVAEAGDPPHLVLGDQRPGQAERDAPGRSRDQDLLVLQHPRLPLDPRPGQCRPGAYVVAMTPVQPDLDQAILAALDGLLPALLDLTPVARRPLPCAQPEPDRFLRVFGGRRSPRRCSPRARPSTARPPHSLHAYFVQAGRAEQPLDVGVDHVRDGRSMATRRGTVTQGDPHAPHRDGLVPRQPPRARGRRPAACGTGARRAPAAAGLAARPAPRARRPRRQLGRPSAAARPAHRRGTDLPRWPVGRHQPFALDAPATRRRRRSRCCTPCCSRTPPTTCCSTWRSARTRAASRRASSPRSASTTRSGSIAPCASTRGTCTRRRRWPSPAIAGLVHGAVHDADGHLVATVMQEVLLRPAVG